MTDRQTDSLPCSTRSLGYHNPGGSRSSQAWYWNLREWDFNSKGKRKEGPSRVSRPACKAPGIWSPAGYQPSWEREIDDPGSPRKSSRGWPRSDIARRKRKAWKRMEILATACQRAPSDLSRPLGTMLWGTSGWHDCGGVVGEFLRMTSDEWRVT